MAGHDDTAAQALNAVILAALLIVFTTTINAFGIKLMAQINSAGCVHRADRGRAS